MGKAWVFGRLKKTAIIPLLLVSIEPSHAASDPNFTGRWRIDTTSFKGNNKPMSLSLRAGEFKKDRNQATKADGIYHRVLNDGYVDEQSIKIESEFAVKEIDKIRGKIVYIVEYLVSDDKNTLTTKVTSYTSPDGQPVKGETVYKRKGALSAQEHMISGEWERESVNVDEKSDWVMALNGSTFSMRTGGGIGYDAIINGGAVKIDGDNAGSKAIITRPQPDTIVETDVSSSGVEEAKLFIQILPDGNTILAKAVYAKGTTTTTFYLRRVVR